MKSSIPLLAGAMALLSGCGGPDIAEYKGRTPKMDVREYFDGKVLADGVYLSRAGVVEDQFHVVMDGDFDDKGGTLHETFTYMDGKKQERI
ncbi:MAG: DUF3833 domain-containing protein, partial [Rickettsiales bacterium]|nr:DUF3833 domain-containing protein [Rickettsiales bacterium]